MSTIEPSRGVPSCSERCGLSTSANACMHPLDVCVTLPGRFPGGSKGRIADCANLQPHEPPGVLRRLDAGLLPLMFQHLATDLWTDLSWRRAVDDSFMLASFLQVAPARFFRSNQKFLPRDVEYSPEPVYTFHRCSYILLQTTPPELKICLERCVREVDY